LESSNAVELDLALLLPLVPLFPQDAEPTQRAGPLGREIPTPVGAGDAKLGHDPNPTMDTYGHLFPDGADLGRGAIENLITEHIAQQGEQRESSSQSA
jgi:hypothetical protein